MIHRPPPSIRSLPAFLLPSANPTQQCVRFLHQRISSTRIPPPTPFVPDHQTFLTLIGRNLSQHAAKIPSWEALFSYSSAQLRNLGVEPARNRRYLLRWREKFRNGEYGVGGDMTEVVDGVGELRVVEVPIPARSQTRADAVATATSSPRKRKVVVNVPQGTAAPAVPPEEVKPVERMKIYAAHTIRGPFVQPASTKVARITVQEGLWLHRRGHKVDGGERRKAEVRAKRRGEERRTTRK
ncbi:MAG: hypothetical protein M1812_004862 [Candelaria pacifica]|nr:MAG: hypothetical protein M1812_004862 [Candelaria pacifica]